MGAIGLGESLLSKGRRLLVISPHPDDETFGCGGLMARAVDAGCEVAVMVISAPEALPQFGADEAVVGGDRRRSEFEAAMEVLGVRDHEVLFTSDEVHMRLDAMPQAELVGLIERRAGYAFEAFRPDIVCMPAPSYNQDHVAVFRAVIAACRPHLPADKAFASLVMEYDQPQLGWGAEPFHPNLHVDIGATLERKLAAYGCYRSQIRREPHHASLANVERLARLRGSEVSLAAAEAFRVRRLVL
ncbi:PIG-L deacetylase family protein [Caulobacter sp. CCNWLY153]|jgi:LmbE family N-acetylglucosaminyl deacetylase|uniref:PIG-L deacetylase family protein n=1 Tax=unclassified Caulobacter TaxID=2648921 RepID=UPI002FF3347A